MLRALLILILGTLSLPLAAAEDRLAAAIANPARSAADRERDARDQPQALLAFAGLRRGMVVADIFGGGGYYSELISYVVGSGGRVLLINNPPYDAYAKDDLAVRLANKRLANVVHQTAEPCCMGMKPGSVDVALIVMSYHDLYVNDPSGGWPSIDAKQFLDQIYTALKPGGTFLIVDHAADAGTGNSAAQTLHRIDEAYAKTDIASHGFVFDGTLDLLHNTTDDHTKSVFDAAIKGKTDRFIHRYRKPAKK